MGKSGLHLTPEILEGAYRFLQKTPPFTRWHLPNADNVVFRVMRSDQFLGRCLWENGHHVIEVSTTKVGHTSTLFETMAHEMVHLYLDRKGVRTEHGREFRNCSWQICQLHGFDYRSF